MGKLNKSSISTIIRKAVEEYNLNQDNRDILYFSLHEVVDKSKGRDAFFASPRIDKKEIILAVDEEYKRNWKIECFVNFKPKFIDVNGEDYFDFVLAIKIKASNVEYKHDIYSNFKVNHIDFVVGNPNIGRYALAKRVCKEVFNIKKLPTSSFLYVKECELYKETERILKYFDHHVFKNRYFEDVGYKTNIYINALRVLNDELCDIVQNEFAQKLVEYYKEKYINLKEAVIDIKSNFEKIEGYPVLSDEFKIILKEALCEGISHENRRLFKKVIEKAIEIKQNMEDDYIFDLDIPEDFWDDIDEISIDD